jgi:MFS family permease
MTRELRRSLATTMRVLADQRLRSLLAAFALSTASSWAYAVALSVFAYDRGGPGAVGVAWLVLMVPAGVAAPFLAVVADRLPADRVLAVSLAARGVAMLGCAVAVATDVSPFVVLALAVPTSMLARLVGPAQAATLPRLTGDDDELAAANTIVSQVEALTTIAGPAIAGVVLVVAGAAGALGLAGLGVCAASLLAARLGLPARNAGPEAVDQETLPRLAEGIRVVASDRELRSLVALFGVQTLLAGALNVFLVIISVRVLHFGAAGVGFLNGALGIGGAFGAVVALLLGGRHLLGSVRVGLVLWGFPLAALAAWPNAPFALALLALMGVGNTLFDVGVYTSIQRAVPRSALARVFGVLEGLAVLSVGLGALAAPALVAACGIQYTLAGAGLAVGLTSLLPARSRHPMAAPAAATAA